MLVFRLIFFSNTGVYGMLEAIEQDPFLKDRRYIVVFICVLGVLAAAFL